MVRRYVIYKNILDIPNYRSSHQIPTPRGGGVAFVLSFIVACVYLFCANRMHFAPEMIWILAGVGLALLGFYDDKYSIKAYWRFLGHVTASCVALYAIGGMPSIIVGGFVLKTSIFTNFFAVIYLTWLINLYNFMDGIDALAASEAIFVCLGASFLYALAGYNYLTLLPLMLASATLGFLFWNFPPAKIFMGDAGSCFLGFMLGVLSLQATWVKEEFFWSWLILLGIFIVDATYTLLRRALNKEKLSEAHRSHAYQHAVSKYTSHLPVTSGIVAINIFWLLPIALLVGLEYINSQIGLLIAYVPLFFLAKNFKAGQKDIRAC